MITHALLAALLLAPVSGEALYEKRCSSCHDTSAERVPPRDVLKKMPVARILRALDFGAMINVAGPIGGNISPFGVLRERGLTV